MTEDNALTYTVFDLDGNPVMSYASRNEYLGALKRLSDNDIEFDQSDACSCRVTTTERNLIVSILSK